MLKLLRDIEKLGGIASRAELRRLGNSDDIIGLAARYGRLVRIRKGWYAAEGLDDDVVRAWRVGGRLACVSAAVHHGVHHGAVEALHVSVPREASRLRTADNHRRRLAAHPDPAVVVHWSRRALEGTRQAVSVEEALAQMRRCHHPDARRA